MTSRGLASALLVALLPGCSAIPPAAIGGIAGAVTAALRLDDDLLKIIVPAASTPQKGSLMPTSRTLTFGAKATVLINIVDQAGEPMPVPPGGSASFDNPAVATAQLAGDGKSVDVIPTGTAGSGNLTYTNGSITFEPLPFEIAAPVASGGSFGDVTLTPLPAS